MKKLSIYIGLFLLTISSCQSQNSQNEKFDADICNCIYSNFDRIGIDIKNELLGFEQYLVDNKQIKDKTGESYLKIYEIIANEDRFPIKSNYLIDNLTLETLINFNSCLVSRKEDLEHEFSESKLMKLNRASDSIVKTGDIKASNFAKAVLNIMDANDFEKELYKIYALNTFYFTSLAKESESLDIEGPSIMLRVTNDQIIYINSKPISVENVATEILKITTDFTEDELSNYVVVISAEKEVKMGVFAKIKEQLKKINVVRIHYQTE